MADINVTVAPSGGDYTTLAAAVAGEGADLTASGMLYIKIENGTGSWSGAPDTTQVDVDGYSTDATHYIKIYTDASNRASTTWSTVKYILKLADTNVFLAREDYFWIDGLQIQIHTQTGAHYLFQNVARTSGLIKLSNSIFRGDGGAQTCKLSVDTSGNFTVFTAWNCIFYHWGSNSESYLYLTDASAAWNFYNCTFIWPTSATCGCRRDGGTLTMKNCFSGLAAAGRDYYGTIALTTCASADTSGDIDNIAINTTNFTDVTIDGGEDWALPLGSGLIGVGTDSVYADAATDINGETRTSTWDIGADEYVVAGPAGSIVPQAMAYYARLMADG